MNLKDKNIFIHILAIALLGIVVFILLWELKDGWAERNAAKSFQSELQSEVVALEKELNALDVDVDVSENDKLKQAVSLAEEQLDELNEENSRLRSELSSIEDHKTHQTVNHDKEVTVENVQKGLEALDVSDHLEYSIYIANIGLKNHGYAEYEDDGYYIGSTYGGLIFMHVTPDEVIDQIDVVNPDNGEIIFSQSTEMRPRN